MTKNNTNIGILKETGLSEDRVSIIPDDISKLISQGLTPLVQSKAGLSAGYSDKDYISAGAKIVAKASDLISQSKIVVKVGKPLSAKEGQEEIAYLKKDQILICNFQAAFEESRLTKLIDKGVLVFALEKLPRITRAQSMDILSSGANLSGYRAVIEASYHYSRSFPMMTTAAGTIKPAKVLILGCGVAGLQAIATAKRLGAIVTANDVRAETKEQVLSLGGKFVGLEPSKKEDTKAKTVYAKEMSEDYKLRQNQLIADLIKDQDIVITTALIPNKQAPILITKEMIKSMQSSSVIFDLAIANGGNVAHSVANRVVSVGGVKIHAPLNILSNMAEAASKVLSTNYINFIKLLTENDSKEVIVISRSDEIIKGCLLEKSNTKSKLTSRSAAKPKAKAKAKPKAKAKAKPKAKSKS